jgi:glycosyltransferase involved in cell wall biosynthesis
VVWAPGNATDAQTNDETTVYRCFGGFGLRAIWVTNRLWVSSSEPKRILLQWSPTGYGLKSANLPFCLWLAWRATRGDELLIVFHEAFLSLSEGPLRRRAAALVERIMTILLLNAANGVFVATSSWIPSLKPYCLRKIDFITQPVPANLTPCGKPEATATAKRSMAPRGEQVIGHFGLYSPKVQRLLIPSLLELLQLNSHIRVSLIGAGSIIYRDLLLSHSLALSARVYATGPCSQDEASTQIAACDAMFQPYPEGITTRRTTAMAALAHGKCLISTLGALTEDIWRSTSAVQLIASREPHRIAKDIEEALSSPRETAQRGSEGLKLYQDHFALPHTIDALLAAATHR